MTLTKRGFSMKANQNIARAVRPFTMFFALVSFFSLQSYANDFVLAPDIIIHELPEVYKNKPKSDWTFIVYIAADNDLRSFAARNIKQMAQIGSNAHVNIVVQLDIRIAGNQKITRRYYIEHNKIYHVNAEDDASQRMDSGDPKTLISCACWAIQNYPANNYALILWNHGTGIIDPDRGRIINPSELFSFNPTSNKLELDRTVGFLDFINKIKILRHIDISSLECDETTDITPRGICWDDSTGNYLTNQKLEYALKEICASVLGGKKINLLGFDACLMSMLEVANIVKKYVNIMVGSQEVELGTGWDYSKVLAPLRNGAMTEAEFAAHIVTVYEDTYNKVTNDYTQSAINLGFIDSLENNVNSVANVLLESLKKQKNGSVKHAIQASRNKLVCTHFDEPSYIDLHHFYTNLQMNLKLFSFVNEAETQAYKDQLNILMEEGKSLITKIVFANTAGKNLHLARGISIYFPERRIHPSYRQTNFASSNKWATLLTQYL